MVALIIALGTCLAGAQQRAAQAPPSLRVYVFDCGLIIKSAPGHTPGHQVLLLKLAKTGPVLIAGDLYHIPEEHTMNRFPTFEFNKEQSAASRTMIDAYLKKTGAQLWIEHDLETAKKLKKAPAYYD